MAQIFALQQAEELHRLVLPPEHEEATIELAGYLLDSFGNPVRIDYGTGHELHFVLWMYALSLVCAMCYSLEGNLCCLLPGTVFMLLA